MKPRLPALLLTSMTFTVWSCGASTGGLGGGDTGGSSSGGDTGGGSSAGRTSSGGAPGGKTGSGGSGGGAGAGGLMSRGGNGGSGGAAGGRSSGGVSGGSGGASATGGVPGGGGTGPSSGGSAGVCTPIASTATRPQLTSADAANFTLLKYFAQSDNWDPTAGLGNASAFTPNFTVAADGSGTHTTVQAAITAAASGTARRFILVKPGTYRGAVSITGSTPITLYGAGTDATQVVIVNNQSASSAGGTPQSATLTSRSNGFQLMNLTVSNDFATPATGTNIQAVALYVTGDKTLLQNVRLHGFQDTLFTDTASETTPSRVYMKGCFIEGDTDFIFGGATLVIDGGTINYLSSRKGTGGGACLAPSTRVANNFGFLVINSTFSSDAAAPANKVSLGRSWDEGGVTPHAERTGCRPRDHAGRAHSQGRSLGGGRDLGPGLQRHRQPLQRILQQRPGVRAVAASLPACASVRSSPRSVNCNLVIARSRTRS